MAVLNELKPGLDQKLYENALVLELQARGHLEGRCKGKENGPINPCNPRHPRLKKNDPEF